MTSDRFQHLSPEELGKVGDTAGKLVLARRLADVIYAVRVNLLPEQVSQKTTEVQKASGGSP